MSHPIDAHIGQRIRQRRWIAKLSQMAVAERLGITFQQLQKYEVGANRVSASRLWEIAQVLEVPVAYFFEGIGAPAGDAPADPVVLDRDSAEMLRAFCALPEAQRAPLLALTRTLGTAQA
jgi:transcriptional regulator with XRE-family HTH domain